MTTRPFRAEGVNIIDPLGESWSIEKATQRMHVIADLLTSDDDVGFNIGQRRLIGIAGAIRQAKINQKAVAS